jgi:TRAP-type C4-dicarboxylate transport system substrate-binding protein
MKKVMVALVGVLFVFSVSQAVAKPITLKFSTAVPAQAAPVAKVFEPWSKLVHQESEGTLTIEVYPGGVLGRDIKMYLKQLNAGVFDIAMVYPYVYGERFPNIDFVSVPFMGETHYEVCLGTQRLYQRGFLRGLDDFKVLACMGPAPSHLAAIFPVRTPEDLKGHKCRTSSKFHADLVSHLGMTPVALSFTKTAEALSRRLVEATIEPPNSMRMWGSAKVAKNHLVIPLGSNVYFTIMNKERYQNLPPKAKAAIDKYSGEWLSASFAKGDAPESEQALESFKQDPEATVVIPKGEDLKRWKAAMQPVIDAWVKARPGRDKLLKAYQEELDRIRAAK